MTPIRDVLRRLRIGHVAWGFAGGAAFVQYGGAISPVAIFAAALIGAVIMSQD